MDGIGLSIQYNNEQKGKIRMFSVVIAGALMGVSMYVVTITTKYIKKTAGLDFEKIFKKLGK